jgi:hypothetical protein
MWFLVPSSSRTDEHKERNSKDLIWYPPSVLAAESIATLCSY